MHKDLCKIINNCIKKCIINNNSNFCQTKVCKTSNLKVHIKIFSCLCKINSLTWPNKINNNLWIHHNHHLAHSLCLIWMNKVKYYIIFIIKKILIFLKNLFFSKIICSNTMILITFYTLTVQFVWNVF